MKRPVLHTCLVIFCLATAGSVCVAQRGTAVENESSSRRIQTHDVVPTAIVTNDAQIEVGQDTAEVFGTPSRLPGPTTRKAIIAVALALAVTTCLITLTVLKGRALGHSNVGDELEILSTIGLAPRCCLTLVRAQDQTILVARDATGVRDMIVVPKGFSTYLEAPPADDLSLTTRPAV